MNMKLPTAPITLLTDFGTRDQYVAEMKGVILQIAPRVAVVDITHEIDPQDVIRAAFVLRQVWNWFPPGTVHLAVVDPGVGSRRRIIAGRYAGQYVICPDNGLISLLERMIPGGRTYELLRESPGLPVPSSTFHGRDIFAPAAALCSAGFADRLRGRPVQPIRLPLAAAKPGKNSLTGEILHIDRFGNCISSLHHTDLSGLRVRRVQDRQIVTGGFDYRPQTG